MKILSRYVLREHVGPFTFALTALTSLMLLNFISRQLGQLVGKGLPWSVIGQFFLLSIPFTVALTLPMSVLVAVLYAFSRLAAENEVTALKASGVSPWRIVAPAIAGGLCMSIGLLAFNDRVLPWANHELKTLQDDISQAKPTFLLKEQVINPIAEGKFYLKAGAIERSGNRLKEIVIYDLADPTRRRTIYADTGSIALAANRTDLELDLYQGQMQEVSTEKPGQLDRLFFDHDRVRIKDVARDFKPTQSESSSKGDREMSICEMQRRLWQADITYRASLREYDAALTGTSELNAVAATPRLRTPEPHGLGWLYCRAVNAVFGVREAHAEQLPAAKRPPPAAARPATARPQDTAHRAPPPRDSAARRDSIAARAPLLVPEMSRETDAMRRARAAESKLRLDIATRSRNRFDIEIHKKFSLAAACLIFVILGAPIAVRFPRGGVGLVIGVSLGVFALYYVGLIGGESLANEGLLPPFWAMWGTNVMLTAVGVVLLFRMDRDSNSGRGGDLGERTERILARLGLVKPADDGEMR